MIDKYPITSFICSLALFVVVSVLSITFLNVVFHYLPFIILGYLIYGKTNIIESIFLCSMGKSFKTQNDKELIKFEKEEAIVELNFEKKDRTDTERKI